MENSVTDKALELRIAEFLRPSSDYNFGDGFGNGSGDGSGDGSGYGYGYGSGDGLKYYNGRKVYLVDDTPTVIEQVRGDIARGFIVRRDLTVQPCFIARVDNCYAHGSTAHEALQDAAAKALEDAPIEERIARFVAEFPDPDAQVPFLRLYGWHHVLTGSCKMGRDEFTAERGLDTGGKYTVRYFIEITRNSYGSDVIKQLAKQYGID